MSQAILSNIIAAGALGDAFGYAIEFDSWNTIRHAHGPAGLQNWPYAATPRRLVVSDDTQMTLFAMEAIAEALEAHGRHLHPGPLRQASESAFLRWLETQGSIPSSRHLSLMTGLASQRILWQRAAPGMTCLAALSGIRDHRLKTNDSKGCGAAMRAAPYATLVDAFGLDFVWRAASDQGHVTHHDVDGYISGAALAFILASQPKSIEDLESCALAAATRAELLGAHGTALCLREACRLRDVFMDPEQMCDALGEGWVGDEAVGLALWAAFRSTGTLQAIRIAANHRGDSDSTASMAGQISSAIWGLDDALHSQALLLDVAIPMRQACARLHSSLDRLAPTPTTT